MRILFKLLLILTVLITGTYATVPMWLPLVFASQLPPGWKLVDINPAYPGPSDIRIKSLSMVADLPLASLTVSANDIRVDYRSRKTDVGAVTLEVSLDAAFGGEQDPFTLDDLALPVVDLSAELPELSVRELRLGIRHGLTGALPDPLLFELRSFSLTPLDDGAWRFDTGLRPEGAAVDAGRLSVLASPGDYISEFRVPADPSVPPWLKLALGQSNVESESLTRVEISLDMTGDWRGLLSALDAYGFLDKAPRLAGKVWAWAEFYGKSMQAFDQSGLSAQGLLAEFDDASVFADLELQAYLEGPEVFVLLPEPGQLRYRDRTGTIDALLARLLPDFELEPQADTEVTAVFDKASAVALRPGDEPGLQARGNVRIGVKSTKRNLDLDVRHLDLELAGFTPQDPLRAQAEIGIGWMESAPVTTRLPGKTLRTQSFSLSSKGVVHLVEQGLKYEQSGQLGLQHPEIALAGDEVSPPMFIAAQSIAAEFDLATRGNTSISNGRARIAKAKIDQPPTAADTVEVAWQDFDLDSMAGQLSARTTGFSTEIDGQHWRDFELDGTFSMDEKAVLRGTAALNIQNGSNLPLEFEGSAVTGRWEVAILPTTIMWNRLENTLRAGKFPWPEGVRMTGGEIALQGQVTVAENVAASLQSRAFGLGAAILENTATDAGYDLDITLADSLSARGPVSIDSAVLAGGVKVTGFAADLELAGVDKLTLQNLQATVFGGTLQAAKLSFTPDGIEDTEIRLMHIDLSRLLAFLDIAGLHGTGALGFLLPLGSDKDGIHVRGGTFESAEPGFLSYRKEGVVAGNVGLQALENFHYQSLSGTLEYQSKGAYRIGVQLEGKNPDLYGGHPIVFRLNINGVMPELFEALFMTGDFEESILRDISTQ